MSSLSRALLTHLTASLSFSPPPPFLQAYFSYGFEALLYNEVVGETYYIDASDWGVETSIPANGRQMLKQIGIVDVVLPANVFALLCFLFAFITVNWLVLRFFVKERR